MNESRKTKAELLMGRVFVNLILNAVDSMPGGGNLKISSQCFQANDEPFLKLCVSDTGCGISDELSERILEPFFTTKNKGIGLGLPICRKIVEAHNGSLSIRSKVG